MCIRINLLDINHEIKYRRKILLYRKDMPQISSVINKEQNSTNKQSHV